MTRLYNDPASFTEDMLVGFLDANRHYAVGVPGGVVRAAVSRPGKVAVVVGGGSGHYPAFCGIVGPGFADGAVVGNVFTSPSAAQAASVARAVENGGGVLLTTGNYAGDVMNFGLAVERLRAEGVDARYLAITDDVASAPVSEVDKRRGIAGDFTVFKAASAAAEQGYDLDGVEQVARRANDRTRTLGVAFDGCTMPGADHPLFTVPAGQMGLGLGIHGEPGVAERPMPTAAELAGVLVDGVLAEAPQAGGRAAVILNGLGRTKYEELFIVWGSVAQRLRDAGVTVVEPEVGELVTSLDMAGCSLTMMWLDEELETLWRAPADTPAYRKGTVVPGASQGARRSSEQASVSAAPRRAAVAGGDDAATRRCAARVVASLEAIATAIAEAEDELGRLDAVAGDGDHGRGMVRGTSAAVEAARTGLEGELSAGQILVEAGDAWAAKAGGTSGVLWGAGLAALGAALGAGDPADESVVGGVRDAQEAVARLGGAEPGDKTMLDALQPFAEVLSDAVGDGQALASAWEAAAERAEQAARETAALRPRVGRARPLADRSVGTPDPGAVSLALCLRAVGAVLTQG